MDAASGLVEVFLRVNGYLTLSEWQIQALDKEGRWETITDVDIVGLRFPGDVFLADSHDPAIQSTLRVRGDLLMLEPGAIDVIIGEVKEGEAVFNPGLKRHETLHTVLQRLGWLYTAVEMGEVVAGLVSEGTYVSPGPDGTPVRTRLVAFGQARKLTTNTIPVGMILEDSAAFIAAHDHLLRSARFANPVADTLKLLHKTGFLLEKEE